MFSQWKNTYNISPPIRCQVRRVFGKLAFFEMQDDTGTIQFYMDKSRMGDSFQSLKDWTDAGDIIGLIFHFRF